MYGELFCKVYNELGWNYYPEAFGEALVSWLSHKGLKPEKILDLGCGTGVLCRLLQRQGMEAWGMDFSEAMIRIAREADPRGHYEVGDMITYRPEEPFGLVTCTGDALNHIHDLSDVGRIFDNIAAYLAPGGYLIFDTLKEGEATAGEPFDIDFDENLHVWFQITKPEEREILLTVKAWEKGSFAFEEQIRETVHDPEVLCQMLTERGFQIERCSDSLEDEGGHSTTCYIIARR